MRFSTIGLCYAKHWPDVLGAVRVQCLPPGSTWTGGAGDLIANPAISGRPAPQYLLLYGPYSGVGLSPLRAF